jgi:hypothetical protein
MSVTQRLCFVAIVLASGALAAPGCLLPDKTVREEEALGLTAFLGGGECEACVASRCADAASRCSEEAACDAHVGCTRDCSASEDTVHPPCFDACRRLPRTETADDLFDCSNTECREECSLGTTFGCVGAYAWPRPEADAVTLNFRIIEPLETTPYPTSNGVMPCRVGTWPCEFEASRAQETAGDGTVALTIPTISPLFAGRQAWFGYFHIEESDDLRRTFVYQNRGEYRDREIDDLPIPSDGALGAYDDDPLEPTKGIVAGQLLDCRGLLNFGGEGLVVSFASEDPASEPARVFYIGDDVIPRELPASLSSGRFLARNVPPGLVTVTVHREEGGAVIAEDEMVVEAGALTVLGLYPGARR